MPAAPTPSSQSGSSSPCAASATPASSSANPFMTCGRCDSGDLGGHANVLPSLTPRAKRRGPVGDEVHVVDRAKQIKAWTHGSGAEDVAGEQRDHRGLHSEEVARRHEELADHRVGHAVDDPGEGFHSAADGAFELAVKDRGARRVLQYRV